MLKTFDSSVILSRTMTYLFRTMTYLFTTMTYLFSDEPLGIFCKKLKIPHNFTQIFLILKILHTALVSSLENEVQFRMAV